MIFVSSFGGAVHASAKRIRMAKDGYQQKKAKVCEDTGLRLVKIRGKWELIEI